MGVQYHSMCFHWPHGRLFGNVVYPKYSNQTSEIYSRSRFSTGFRFGWVQLLGTSDRRKRGFRPKPDNPVQVLESTFDVHVAGDSDTSLFDKTGYKKFLLRVDGTHYAQATLFVWEESYDLKEERTWPLVSIALFDEDGKPVKLQSVESKKESESVER